MAFGPMGLSMLGLKAITSAGHVLGGGSGGGRGGHPLDHSGMSIYGPIKNLPPHIKRMVYTGLPVGGHGQGISQRSIKEMQDRDLAPPGVQTHFGPKVRTGVAALRALNINKNLDPIYLPSGELRPALISEGIGSLAPTPVTPETPASPTPDTGGFLTEAQELSTSLGIPIQQAIISLASSRGLDPNQFLNISSGGIGSIGPGS